MSFSSSIGQLLRRGLGAALPQQTGTLRVPGAIAPLTIRRDRWSIPYIEAQSDEDAWYGLGFCQGQDRSFQLELLQRVCRGTLAALVGRQGLPVDRLARRIGFYRAAQAQQAVVAPDVLAAMAAFCRGINDGRSLGSPVRAPELLLLGRRPTAWTVADVLAMAKFVGFLMATNWDTQIVRLRILATDGPEALAALEPAYDPRHPVNRRPGAAAGPALDHLAADLAAFRALAGEGMSNSWAVGGGRTKSGHPLLANDPHLDASLPCQFYLCHLRTPEWTCVGAAFAGSPGISTGHNGFAAWGVTNGKADTSDLFLEEISSDGRSVRAEGGFQPCQLVREVIAVRGGADVIEEVLITPRGPVIGPAIEEIAVETRYAVSLQATWLAPRPLRGLIDTGPAKDFGSFRRLFAEWPSAALNITYADAGGTVGWQLVGELPARRRGYGLLPQPGWDPACGWEPEPLPFHELPWFEGKGAAIVASANNKPDSGNDGPFLGAEWTNGYRAQRIYEALAERQDWDVAATLALQLDCRSLVWRDIKEPVLASVSVTEPAARQAIDLLRGWDGEVDAHSPAAAVFELFMHEMTARICAVKAPRSWHWAAGCGIHRLRPFNCYAVSRISHTVALLREQPPGWFEHGWPRELSLALCAVADRLVQLCGPDQARWGWGEVRPLTFKHLLGDAAPLGRVLNLGPYPWGGDTTTLSMATSDPVDPVGQNPIIVATLRWAVDLGDPDGARFIHQGGQSGNVLSPHYDDLMPLWLRGESVPIPYSPAAVDRVTVQTLLLEPR